jgi:hypothetical protein
MSWLGDVGNFEYFNLGKMAQQIGENPARLLYGSADPFSTNVWNKVLGTNDKPLVDQWGGAAKQRYQEAEDAGINTGPGATMHGIARTIASFYAGGAAGNAAGGGSAASGASGASGMGGGTGVTAGGSGIGFTGDAAGSAYGMGGGSGVTYGAGSAGGSGGLLAGGSSTASQSPGVLAQFKEGYDKVKPVMDAASTGMKVSQQLQGPQTPPVPPPQITPPTTNQSLQGILAQLQATDAARMQDSQLRRQQRRNLIGG